MANCEKKVETITRTQFTLCLSEEEATALFVLTYDVDWESSNGGQIAEKINDALHAAGVDFNGFYSNITNGKVQLIAGPSDEDEDGDNE